MTKQSPTKICVVTGTRAEYGLLKPLLTAFVAHQEFELQLLATGTHLSREYGSTIDEIRRDNFDITAEVDMLLSSDSDVATAKSAGLGVIGYADALANMQPDFLLLLGDRYEALAAAQTAMLLRIPIIHLHGGELTKGAIDESIRHAITKMASLHFVATADYQKRVIQLGENPNSVFNVGALGVENARLCPLLSRPQLAESLGTELNDQLFLATYHPETRSQQQPAQAMAELTQALDSYPDSTIIFTYPNADSDGQQIVSALEKYAAANPKRVVVERSLGLVRYLSALKHADLVIGNSSSGIIEAPSLKTPTVNIGQRQGGRIYADSVIHCGDTNNAIKEAIEMALSEEFKNLVASVHNPYEGTNTSKSIIDELAVQRHKDFTTKEFFDIDF